MTRTLLVGLLLFVVFAVAFAPASLMRMALPAGSGAELLDTEGTVWDGSGDLFLAGERAGRLRWDFQARSVLHGAVDYHVSLSGPQQNLSGTVALGTASGEATLSGRTTAAYANRWLMPYDIAISGDIEFQDARIQVPYDFASAGGGKGSGAMTWSGGPVRYRLSGRNYASQLPPLVAYLGEGLEAVVYPKGGQTPLLHLTMLQTGFIRISVTQLLTEMVGNPWPGSHEDHDVVLEVEEQLF